MGLELKYIYDGLLHKKMVWASEAMVLFGKFQIMDYGLVEIPRKFL